MHAYDPKKDPLSVDKWMLPARPSQPRSARLRPSSETDESQQPRARDIKFVVTACVLLGIALAYWLVSWFDMPGRMAGQ